MEFRIWHILRDGVVVGRKQRIEELEKWRAVEVRMLDSRRHLMELNRKRSTNVIDAEIVALERNGAVHDLERSLSELRTLRRISQCKRSNKKTSEEDKGNRE